MKIKRSVLVQLVKEELAAHIRSLREADVADAEDDKKGKEKEKAASAGGEEKKEKKPAHQPDPDNSADKPKSKAPPKKVEPPEEAPEMELGDDPSDDSLQQDVGGTEDAGEVTGGKIADEVAGKTVQSLTMSPKSKIIPGAQEITITFDQIPDPLRILVQKSGNVTFYFRGLHNSLD